jgi:hypothetical protein
MSAGRHPRSPANRSAFGQKTGSDDPAGGVCPKPRRAVFSGAVQRSGRSTVVVVKPCHRDDVQRLPRLSSPMVMPCHCDSWLT